MHEHEHRCGEMLGSLSEYLDGELPECLCAEIERHLKECGDCRVMVDTMRKTVVLYHDYGHENIPVDAKERLYKVLHLDQACKQ